MRENKEEEEEKRRSCSAKRRGSRGSIDDQMERAAAMVVEDERMRGGTAGGGGGEGNGQHMAAWQIRCDRGGRSCWDFGRCQAGGNDRRVRQLIGSGQDVRHEPSDAWSLPFPHHFVPSLVVSSPPPRLPSHRHIAHLLLLLLHEHYADE